MTLFLAIIDLLSLLYVFLFNIKRESCHSFLVFLFSYVFYFTSYRDWQLVSGLLLEFPHVDCFILLTLVLLRC